MAIYASIRDRQRERKRRKVPSRLDEGKSVFVLELSGRNEPLTGPDEVIVSGSAGSNQK